MLAFALYALTFGVRSDGQLLGGDAMPYASQVATGDPAGTFNAHHLLFHPLARGLGALLGVLEAGDGGTSALAILRAQRLLSALGGALTVAFVFAFARRFTDVRASALVAAGLALSYGHWLFSSVGETYTTATAAMALTVLVATDMRLGRRPERALPVGLALLAAVLFRQDAVLVVAALPFLLRPATWIVATGFAGFTSLALYALAWAVSGLELPFVEWLRGLAGDGTWGHAPGGDELSITLGLTATSVHYGFVPLRRVLGGSLDDLFPHLASAGAALVALAVALVPLRRTNPPEADRSGRRAVLAALSALVLVRFAFFAWWEPGNVEHHSGSLFALFGLLAVALPARPGTRRTLALAAAIALGTATHLATAFLPNRVETTSERAHEAAELAGEAGLVVGLNSFAAHALLREPPTPARSFDGSFAAILRAPGAGETLTREVAGTLERGGTVVLLRAVAIWEHLLLTEPPIDLALVAALQGLGQSRNLEDEDGQIWAVVIEPAP